MTEEAAAGSSASSGTSAEALTELFRLGARQLIEQAFEAEISDLKAKFSKEEGHAHSSRHGHQSQPGAITKINTNEAILSSLFHQAPIYTRITGIDGKAMFQNWPNHEARKLAGEECAQALAISALPEERVILREATRAE